ncbi:MAG: glycosyltransferase family 39 protein [Synechococcaceae cyanobacterium]|nr:glycosyltransferase family 39 protein [Synechococcaceae cyanobacterium]
MKARARVLLITLLLGLGLFVWRLGHDGLVDETPPLFAASARAMAETGDWLIPRVNGLPRYDKPPLVYWLMGLLYALPGQARWNPLGTWAAGLPSALSTVLVMLALADTVMRWPLGRESTAPAPRWPVALGAALAFALSPLVLLWGRIPVSDALFSGLVAINLLLCWRRYAAGPTAAAGAWWHAWVVLALAVLAKGPVAVVLLGLSLGLFAWMQADGPALVRRLRPVAGLGLTAALALPWYALALAREGQPFWDSFFGYHNLQRFTSVVNRHLQPWWYFVPVLLVAALPATPLLLLGLARAIGRVRPRLRRPVEPLAAPDSLGRFAACWLLAVLLFFTAAATKLPSYWLPATPAAGLLIALAARSHRNDRAAALARILTGGLTLLLGGVFLAAPLWVPRIQDPEMPTLPAELLASGRLPIAAACFLLAALAALLPLAGRPRASGTWLLALQLPLVAFVPLALLPSWSLGDRLRGLPVRTMAAVAARELRPGESLAMVGILKPSLHYYSRRVVLYEGNEPRGLVNLADRLAGESRVGQRGRPAAAMPTVLMVIDQGTAALPFWRDLEPQTLARSGLYRLWRLERSRLEARAAALRAAGVRITWRDPVPERY